MNTTFSPLLALTMGDPAGIGPEIIVRAWAADPGLMQACCVVGDLATMRRALDVCQQQGAANCSQLRPVSDWQEARQLAGQADVLPLLQGCSVPTTLPSWGKVQQQAGAMAAECIVNATQAVLRGSADAIVTAPIHKEALALAGIDHPGHTELLQALAASHAQVAVADMPVRMMLANPELKTVLNSIHVSLRQAIDQVTMPQVLQTLRITDQFLRRTLGGRRNPVIAVAGLNPHAGEGGLFGTEELDAIIPAIEQARAEGIQALGPFPPDTVFMQARRHAADAEPFCDAVLAMYHDQGLIPVKYLGVEQGVNVTLGLPLIRTSPDHGTAFDLAGTARADCASLLAAVRLARQMAAASN